MKIELGFVDNLISIIKADDDYFVKARQLTLKKIRGSATDFDSQALNDSFEKAMELRRQFIDNHGGLDSFVPETQEV